MPDPFFEAPRPLVFAHRGGAGLAPENTFAAFDQGIALGADGLELAAGDLARRAQAGVVWAGGRPFPHRTRLIGELTAQEWGTLRRPKLRESQRLGCSRLRS